MKDYRIITHNDKYNLKLGDTKDFIYYPSTNQYLFEEVADNYAVLYTLKMAGLSIGALIVASILLCYLPPADDDCEKNTCLITLFISGIVLISITAPLIWSPYPFAMIVILKIAVSITLFVMIITLCIYLKIIITEYYDKLKELKEVATELKDKLTTPKSLPI